MIKLSRIRQDLDWLHALRNKSEIIEAASEIKWALQVLIGILLVLVLLVKLVLRLAYFLDLHSYFTSRLLDIPTMTLVGLGLAYSAGFELAYMLVTPGPDEAIQPVIVGLAAGVLITISKVTISTAEVFLIPLACLSIGFLLYLQREFASTLTGRHIVHPVQEPASAATDSAPTSNRPDIDMPPV